MNSQIKRPQLASLIAIAASAVGSVGLAIASVQPASSQDSPSNVTSPNVATPSGSESTTTGGMNQ